MLYNFITKVKAVNLGVPISDGTTEIKSADYATYVHAIYDFSLRLGGSLVVLMLIYAGYIYITSRGDTSKLTQAKDVLVGTLIGFMLLFVIGIILDFIGLPRQGI